MAKHYLNLDACRPCAGGVAGGVGQLTKLSRDASSDVLCHVMPGILGVVSNSQGDGNVGDGDGVGGRRWDKVHSSSLIFVALCDE